MNAKDYNFDKMLEGASSIVDEDTQDTSIIDEVSSIYKLDEVLLSEGWDYDANGIYIHFKPTFQSIGVEDDDKFTTKDNIYLWISRDFETRKKILLKFKWAIKTSDGYSLARGFTFDNSLDIGDEKILKDLNKKVSFSGGKNENPSSEGSYVNFVDDFTSKIIDSPQLEVFKNEDYDAPEFEDEEILESESSNVVQCFDDYPEDIQQESMKLLNDGALFGEIQNSVSLTHEGDYTSRDALILMEASLFVDGKGNALNSVHGLIGGDSGGGKSDLAIVVGLNFPKKYVKNLRNTSPKYPYYDNENFNEDYNIIVFDDPRLTEELIELIKLFADNTSIEKVLKTVKNQEPLVLSFGDAKFVVILTYAKTIPDDELANRLFNLGVIIDDEKPDVSDKVRDNNQTNGNFNPIIERNRLIIQASIHYLIEQEINVFNPFLSIFNTRDYISRDVNHVHHMIKTKTFFEYPQRRQIQVNDDLAITIGAFEDFKFVSDIWSEDVDAQKYKLSERQKQILKLLPEMTRDEAYQHIEDLNDKLDIDSRNAKDKILEDEFTKKTIARKLKCNQNTLVNDLDRNNQGTSKSLYELGLIDKIQIYEDVKNSPNIYYKIKNEGDTSNLDETTMYNMYSQFTQLISYSFTKQKIIIDLLYYVKIIINERGYTYLQNYCDNYDKEIDVESYDSIVDFIQGFFDGFNYDEYSISIDNAPLDVITQMAKYKHQIDNLFNEKNNGNILIQNSEVLHSNENEKDNPPIDDSSKSSICKNELHSEHSNKSTIQALLKEKRINVEVGYSILNILFNDDEGLTKYEIQRKMYPNPNPDDVDERLVLAIDTNLQKLVDKGFVTIKTTYGMIYHLEEDIRKLFEGDDD